MANQIRRANGIYGFRVDIPRLFLMQALGIVVGILLFITIRSSIWMKRRHIINYTMLLVAFSILWGAINLWVVYVQIYSLNNSSVVDTSTALQSLGTFFLHKPFINTDPGGSYFAIHASEFLYVLLVGYSINHSALTLYAIELIITYSASVPLFLLSKRLLKDEKTAFIIGLVYIFSPYIHISPFELLTLFMGLIIFAIYFLETRHYSAFAAFLLLSMSTMEFAPLMAIAIGLYVLLVHILRTARLKTMGNRIVNRIMGLLIGLLNIKRNHYLQLGTIIVVSSVMFYFLDVFVISYFSNGTHPITSNLAGAGIDILPTIPSKFESFMELNSPGMMISFLDPVWLLELPWVIAAGITNFGAYWSPNLYYDSYVVPFVMISLIYGIRRVSSFMHDRASRIKLQRILATTMLLISIFLLISGSLIPMAQQVSTGNVNKGADVAQLASLIPSNQSVFTGANEMPIVSAHTPDTWIYGGPQNYTLFNGTDSSPYNVSQYGLVAASGSYILMEKSYESSPVFNDYYVEKSITVNENFAPLSTSTSLFIPTGNYSAKVLLDYTTAPIYKSTLNQNNVSYHYVSERYAIIQPFSVNSKLNLTDITVLAQMLPGYYTLQSMITSNMHVSGMITQDSISRNQYNTPFLQFSFQNTVLMPNTTYYFWLWSSGDPGGLYMPFSNNTSQGYASAAYIYNGTGTNSYGYYFTSYSNLTSLNRSLEFSIVGQSSSPESRIYPTTFSLGMDGNNITINVTGTTSAKFSIRSNANMESTLLISSPFLNGTLNYVTLQLTANGTNNQQISASHYDTYIWLLPIFLVFLGIAAVSIMGIGFSRSRKLGKIFKLISVLSASIFYFQMSLFYFYNFYSKLTIMISSIILVISVFVFMMTGNMWDSPSAPLKTVLSIYEDDDE